MEFRWTTLVFKFGGQNQGRSWSLNVSQGFQSVASYKTRAKKCPYWGDQ